MTAAVTTGIVFQLKPAHPSRWGHWAAGRWLAANAKPGEAVLDTRGWAAFVSGLPSYDYWHVRQALTDSQADLRRRRTDELKAAEPPRARRCGPCWPTRHARRGVPRAERRARRRGPDLPVRPARLVGGPAP